MQLLNYMLPCTYTYMHAYIFRIHICILLFDECPHASPSSTSLPFGFLPPLPPPGPPYYHVELPPPYPDSYNLSGGGGGSDEDPLLGEQQPAHTQQAPPISQGKPSTNQHPAANMGQGQQQQQQYPPSTYSQQYPHLPDVNTYEVAGINGYTGGQYPQATRPRDGMEPTERTGLLNS